MIAPADDQQIIHDRAMDLLTWISPVEQRTGIVARAMGIPKKYLREVLVKHLKRIGFDVVAVSYHSEDGHWIQVTELGWVKVKRHAQRWFDANVAPYEDAEYDTQEAAA